MFNVFSKERSIALSVEVLLSHESKAMQYNDNVALTIYLKNNLIIATPNGVHNSRT
tara:strand:- start:5243 stop:5410 length:168 start_codon:yes stop_codon:yes gene_type:complete